jgi:RND family efflux transporter MFP subunit
MFLLESLQVNRLLRNGWCLPLLAAWAAIAGCEKPAAGPPPSKPPEVEVALPESKEITDHEDFTGQTEATRSVDIRARVTGYLKAVHFKHGAIVSKGDPLLEIEPTHYVVEVDRASGVVAEAEARLKRLNLDHERARKLHPTGTITKEQFDLISGNVAEAEATLQAARASLKMANVNLGYCKIAAPFDGRLSRPFIDPGNLVKADDTLLTRVVAQDPIWVYFDLDERTMLRLRRLSPDGGMGTEEEPALPVFMGLSDEQGYPHQGRLDFEDNRLDPATGTLRIRAVFDNPDRLLSAGLFVRVRLQIGKPHPALLIPEPAVGTDQGQKFLYVVDSNNEVSYRAVEVGKQYDGKRMISKGLQPGEKVVVVGLQRVRPGVKVNARPAGTPQTAEVPSSNTNSLTK